MSIEAEASTSSSPLSTKATKTTIEKEINYDEENNIEIRRSSMNRSIDEFKFDEQQCTSNLNQNETIFTDSDVHNMNDENGSIVDSLKSTLSIQNEEQYDDNSTALKSDWDLTKFLDENSTLRHDIDVLIMSEAGKPIYCYSRRQDVTTLMGVCVALINYVIKTQNNQLKTIRTKNGLNIHFSLRSPLVIVVVCRQLTCFDEQILINQIHAQIISTITLKKLKSIFQQAPTYDLKRIIHRNDFKTLDILVKSITTPITYQFPTFKNKRHKLSNGRIFNNVISFYTSMPRLSTSTSSNSFFSLSSSNNSNINNNSHSSMIYLHDHKQNALSRVYVPIEIMSPNLREQINMIINQSVVTNTDIVFSILFHMEDDDQLIDDNINEERSLNSSNSNAQWNHFEKNILNNDDDQINENNDNDSTNNDLYESCETSRENQQSDQSSNNDDRIELPPKQSSSSSSMNKISKNFKLISVCNHTNKFRMNPLDIQLLYALIKASDSLLSSNDTLWIPICLSRVDPNRFLHAHISYLSKKYCLIILDVDHNNFEKCRQVKEAINFKLDQIRLTEPMIGLGSNITELGQPHLQYLCHQTPRHCVVWQSSIQTEFSSLNYYLIERMQRSSLKTLWLRNLKEQCALLGWQTASFQLYAQFDGFVTKQSALETVDTFIKWFKKEEDKLIIER